MFQEKIDAANACIRKEAQGYSSSGSKSPNFFRWISSSYQGKLSFAGAWLLLLLSVVWARKLSYCENRPSTSAPQSGNEDCESRPITSAPQSGNEDCESRTRISEPLLGKEETQTTGYFSASKVTFPNLSQCAISVAIVVGFFLTCFELKAYWDAS